MPSRRASTEIGVPAAASRSSTSAFTSTRCSSQFRSWKALAGISPSRGMCSSSSSTRVTSRERPSNQWSEKKSSSVDARQ
jgi:hypothetical protein